MIHVFTIDKICFQLDNYENSKKTLDISIGYVSVRGVIKNKFNS